MERVTVEADPDLTAHREANPRDIPARVTIAIGDETYVSRVDAPLGHARRPMTDEQLTGKFRSLCRGLLEEHAVTEARALAGSVRELETVDPLVDTLVV